MLAEFLAGSNSGRLTFLLYVYYTYTSRNKNQLYMAGLIDLQHYCVSGRIVQPEFVTAESAYFGAARRNGEQRSKAWSTTAKLARGGIEPPTRRFSVRGQKQTMSLK
jgi:hypothetical protein